MWFRLLLTIGTLLLFVSFAWLATHISDTPVVLGRWSLPYSAMLTALLAGASSLLLIAGPLYARVHARRYDVAVLLIATTVSLGLAEFAIRSLDLFGISYYAESGRYHRNKLPDPDLFYTHEPNSIGIYQGTEVRINSLGLRDREVVDKERGEYRVLFLGDSVTFGWGVSEEQVFVRRLETILTNRMSRQVRTLNSGVGSYNTDSERAFLERHGEQLDPNLVVLVYVTNDVNGTPHNPFDPDSASRLKGKSPPQVVNWALGHSWIYRALAHFIRYAAPPTTSARATILDTTGWEASERSLRAIALWCNDHGIPFVIYLARMTNDTVSDAIFSGLQDVAYSMEIPLFDTLPWFEGADIRGITNSIVDRHPNSEGHGLYAEGIAVSLWGARIFEQ